MHELEAEHARRLAAWPPGRPVPAALRDVPWLLEELRVSHFAQALGTRGQVSAKRIRKAARRGALTHRGGWRYPDTAEPTGACGNLAKAERRRRRRVLLADLPRP